ncbi:uncharacterized protein LOC134284937 [Aedes albopictus]|uniref:PHD-type domain-containing protein n=1 Tax=Aedes albopictus TaxID=7160 RepID=A0ABM1ZNV2_AEDAL
MQKNYFVTNKSGHCRLCDKPDEEGKFMVCCDECDRWFHLNCAGLSQPPKKSDRWICVKCSDMELMWKGRVSNISMLGDPNDDLKKSLCRPSLMELPYFDGSHKVWPRFKMTFDQTTRAGGFSDLENLTRLQKYLKGDALKSVSSLLIDPNNINAIMNRLENRFGRVEAVYTGLIRDIFQVKTPRYDNPQSIIDFVGAIGSLVTNMQSLNHPEYLNDQRLLRDLTSKLPENLRGRWIESLEDQKALATPQAPYVAPTISEFYDWLKPHENLATVLMSERNPRNERTNQINFHDKKNPSLKCIICRSAHKTSDCFKFKQMDVMKRRELAAKEKICYACCNSTTHVALNCKFSKPCKIDGCGRKHHALLHIKQGLSKGGKEETVNCHLRRKNKIFYEIIPVILKYQDKEIETFAFLDSGSSASLVQQDIVNELGIKGINSPMTLAWTNGKTIRENNSQEVQIEICGMKGRTYTLNNINTVEKLSLPYQSLDREELIHRYPYLSGIDIQGYYEAEPKLLLGQPHAFLMIGLEGRSRAFNKPIARRTKLGWVVHGQLNRHPKQKNINHIFMINDFEAKNTDEISMKGMMPNYFSTEGFGVKVPQEQLISKQEKAIETVKNNQQYNDKINMLEKQLMHIQENYKNETENSQNMKKQLTELRLSKSDVEKKAKDLQSQVISLQAAQDALQQEVADLRTRIPLESARIQMTELQKELEGMIHSLVGNLDRSVTREQQAIEDNRNLSNKISEVEKKITSIECELKAVQSLYNQEVKEPQIKLNKAKVACQKIDYRQTQQRFQKLEGEYRHESEKVLALHSQLEQEQNKKSSLLSELSLQSSEAAHLKDKETQLVKKVQQFQETKRKKNEEERTIFDVSEAYKDITGRADEILWEKPIDEELKPLADNHVFQLVERLDDLVPPKSKCVDGEPERMTERYFFCNLERSLYGFKRNPHRWNNQLKDLLLELGFTRSQHDYCLYTRITDRGGVYIIKYAENLLIIGDRMDLVRAIKLAPDGSGEGDQKLQLPDFGEVNNIFEDLKLVRPGTAFILFGDNRGCIAMITNTEIKRVKHIDVKHHFLRDHVAQGRLQIEAIGTANQIADTFTKPLEPGRFRELRTLLGLTDSGGVLE